jgi:glycerol-3-phosphate dehydrogenase
MADASVVVVGGGVVGAAVARELARRDVATLLLEAEDGLALGASGTNSGILHTGFDSAPGELETELILRAAALREEQLDALGVPVLRCGARLHPRSAADASAVEALRENAAANDVRTERAHDGSLRVPGEAVTDPVAYVHALAAQAVAEGAEVRTGARVEAIERDGEQLSLVLAGGARVRARALVNCAGLFADELAAMAGDEIPPVYPRKGEFLVFAAPAGEQLREILLPVPSAMGKGVLVFPTVDGHVIAGPTAREREDKRDWSVERDARALILERALRMWPPLEGATQVAAYAGLRPAGRGANYVIERSHALPAAIHVAAIRSTGLSSSLAIAERAADMLGAMGALPGGPRGAASRDAPAAGAAAGVAAPAAAMPWWQRASSYRAERPR